MISSVSGVMFVRLLETYPEERACEMYAKAAFLLICLIGFFNPNISSSISPFIS